MPASCGSIGRRKVFAAALSALPLKSAPAHAGEGHTVTAGGAHPAARGIAVRDGILAHPSALNLRHQLVGAA